MIYKLLLLLLLLFLQLGMNHHESRHQDVALTLSVEGSLVSSEYKSNNMIRIILTRRYTVTEKLSCDSTDCCVGRRGDNAGVRHLH